MIDSAWLTRRTLGFWRPANYGRRRGRATSRDGRRYLSASEAYRYSSRSLFSRRHYADHRFSFRFGMAYRPGPPTNGVRGRR